jgi:hypothetical protein
VQAAQGENSANNFHPAALPKINISFPFYSVFSMVINVYTSNPADQGLAGFALALGHNLCRPVRLLPLTQLPAPDPLRLPQKRVERTELREAIEAVATHLALYAAGELAPDAGKEAGLRFTLDALNTRLKGVNAVLSSVEKGGVDNG